MMDAATGTGPRPNYDIKKKTTLVGGYSFLEREKGMMAAPVTLLTQGWLATLRAYRYAIISKFFPRASPTKEFSRTLDPEGSRVQSISV